MILLSLLACADPPPPEAHHLTDLFRPMIQLNTGSVPGGPEQVQLLFHPEFPGVCHPMPVLIATLDGKPMTRLHGRVEGATPYDRDCAVFEFLLDPADIVVGDTHVLTITDETTTWRMAMGAVFQPRTLTRASDAPVKGGDQVTLSWTPPTDVLDPKSDAGLELSVGTTRAIVRRADITFEAGSLRFVVPEGISGSVSVTVFGTESIRPPVTACEGPHKCGVSRSYSVPPLTLEIAAPAAP